MYTYMNKRKASDRAVSPTKGPAPNARNAISSRSELLHLSGAGAPQPMSPQLREKFEPGFSADFSNIRISRGYIPESLGVQAVAQGTDILLDHRAGMDVLGHELAHVVQQAQGRVADGFPVVENAALEHEADVMGQRAASGLPAREGLVGETMAIAPMSAASAPAQCKIGKDKPKKNQASAPEQAAPAPASSPTAEQRSQWHAMLSPSAQRYLKPEHMQNAPTISHDAMDRQVAAREEYFDKRLNRSEKFRQALQAKYNDSAASLPHSGPGEMKRRMEALFDPGETAEANSYNTTMMDALDTIEHTQGTTGTVTMDEALVQKIGVSLAPMVRQLNAMGGDTDSYKQFAKDNFAESKFLSGKIHAAWDMLKKFDKASRDKVFHAAGFSGSHEDFNSLTVPITHAISAGWVESGAEMGVRNNDVLSGINVASKNGTYTPQQQTAPAPQQPTGRPRSDTAFSSPAALGLGAPAQPAGRARSDTTFSSPAALGLGAPAQPAGRARSDTTFSSPAALGLGAPAQPAGRARSDTVFSSVVAVPAQPAGQASSVQATSASAPAAAPAAQASISQGSPVQPAGQASSVQATSASAPAAAPAAQASISQGSPVHPALLALMNETPEDENKDLANMRILEPTEDDRGSIQFASPKKHWWQRLRKK